MLLSPIDWTIIALYLIGCTIAGVRMRKYVQDVDDFAIAAREVETSLGVTSLAATGLEHPFEFVRDDWSLTIDGTRHDRSTLGVIDFGVAYVPGMPDLGSDRIVGRPDFMAPEQTLRGAKVDGRADV